MNKFIKTTNLLNYPSFSRGTARVFDLFGNLDSYNYSDNPDFEAIQNDWLNVGNDINFGVNNFQSDRK